MAKTDRLPGLHALRAIAAIVVFVLHCLYWSANWNKPAVDFASAYFPMGVQLFYVASAFALMYSTRRYQSRKGWVRDFYLKRFFRIAPLYYVLIPVTIALSAWLFGAADTHKTTAAEIVANVFFVNNLWPQYAAGIPGAGWSVSVEMLFYLIFPLIFVFVRSIRAALVLALAAVIIGELSRAMLDSVPLLLGDYGELAFTTNFRYFAFGVLAYLAYDRLRASPPPALVFPAAGAAILAAIFGFDAQLRAAHRFDIVLWGALFAVLTAWVTVRPIRALGWAPLQFLGERSYSLYLVHMPVLMLLRFATSRMYDAAAPHLGAGPALALVVALNWLAVVAASSLTYVLIERPGMQLGRRISRLLPASTLERA